MKIITKPWGKEEWIELNDKYCYKRIHILAGHKTSYQYHNFKTETNYIISGEAEIWLENESGLVEKNLMKEGEFFNVLPKRKHRVIALTNIILQEVSTPEVDDVIRIEDDTKRPDGKIEGEHKTPAVLIVCAGLGTRLESLTKHINKTLLPINNRAIISHIIDYFPSDYDFVITKGYEGDSVEEYCTITHPNHKFTFVNVDKFEGEGTGPGYSTLQCKQHLQRPFYFITGDCMIDSPLPYLDSNWLGGYPTSYPEKYSTIQTDEHENIDGFTNKNLKGYSVAFIGMGGILNYEVFWRELETNIKNGELVSAFENPSNYPTLKLNRLKWFDTGSLDDLMWTRRHMGDKPLSLQKETSEITYHDNGMFLKFVPNKTLLNNRVSRAKQLKSIIPSKFWYSDHFMYYNWEKGKTLYELDNIKVFNKFLFQLLRNIETPEGGQATPQEFYNFYQGKTSERFEMFINKNGIRYCDTEFEINGKKCRSISNLASSFHFGIEFRYNPCYKLFHGDLQFDNIIYNDETDEFKYIDWRDSFGGNIEVGDIYYDLAKLYGGLLIPYNIMKDENKINLIEGTFSIEYNFPVSENLRIFRTTYEKWVDGLGFSMSKVKLITGLIFLNMSPLHDEKFGKLLWFKSIEMLSEYYDK
jgi:NDP-sugar pyrophosphorylase family protein/mannose-6-phosphate isomerase-like protein (cupin superfamily)